ncbi:MAG TPA: fumarylacetoacetate hydrolase family protein [Bacillota bacterium]|nr:fumarylacetoacetate hydrolase family protein [Bacillota bacterium]
MKLVHYQLKDATGESRIGWIEESKVYDLQESFRLYALSQRKFTDADNVEALLPANPTTFFKGGCEMIARAKEAYTYVLKEHKDVVFAYDRTDVILKTPIPEPQKVICVGRNYKEHAEEMKGEIPEIPVLFSKFPNALIGPEDNIHKSKQTDKLDYEVELTIVIGKEASQVKQEDAYDYIAGYTIGNDTTARDIQKRTLQWLQGKTMDHTSPFGPWVVLKEDIPAPDQLEVRTFVNDELRQQSNTNKLIFDIPFLIEFISGLITLQPGDMIMTGTPEGVGAGMNPPTFLEDGDIVRLEIDQIGSLVNTVVQK